MKASGLFKHQLSRLLLPTYSCLLSHRLLLCPAAKAWDLVQIDSHHACSFLCCLCLAQCLANNQLPINLHEVSEQKGRVLLFKDSLQWEYYIMMSNLSFRFAIWVNCFQKRIRTSPNNWWEPREAFSAHPHWFWLSQFWLSPRCFQPSSLLYKVYESVDNWFWLQKR